MLRDKIQVLTLLATKGPSCVASAPSSKPTHKNKYNIIAQKKIQRRRRTCQTHTYYYFLFQLSLFEKNLHSKNFINFELILRKLSIYFHIYTNILTLSFNRKTWNLAQQNLLIMFHVLSNLFSSIIMCIFKTLWERKNLWPLLNNFSRSAITKINLLF